MRISRGITLQDIRLRWLPVSFPALRNPTESYRMRRDRIWTDTWVLCILEVKRFFSTFFPPVCGMLVLRALITRLYSISYTGWQSFQKHHQPCHPNWFRELQTWNVKITCFWGCGKRMNGMLKCWKRKKIQNIICEFWFPIWWLSKHEIRVSCRIVANSVHPGASDKVVPVSASHRTAFDIQHHHISYHVCLNWTKSHPSIVPMWY